MGIGHPQYLCRDTPQSFSLKFIFFFPKSFFSKYSIALRMESSGHFKPFKNEELFMKRREFLTTSSGALCFSHLVRAEEHSFKGKIKKAVKFGTKPNEKQMQKLL